jgi:predicted NUDIX family NTP pyrophosphohydrolase
MAVKKSAGILLFNNDKGKLLFFLVHPGGPFWVKKDEGAWSIPKGEFENEEPLAAATREFYEETGFRLDGDFIPLTPRKQKSGKVIYAWALKGDVDAASVKSNLFELEWPPKSGKEREFPEVDKAAWYPLPEALLKINPGQKGFIDELTSLLNN